MKVVTLIENAAEDTQRLIAERGLSIYIEKENTKIIFDTGRTGAFIQNAKYLGIDINAIDFVVLSHWHADHAGGLLLFLQKNSRAIVYMKNSTVSEFYFKYGFVKKKIGLNKEIFEKYSDRVKFVNILTEVAQGVFIIPEIIHSYDILGANKLLFAEKNGVLVSDDFEHEMFMVIKDGQFINIFTGCSHNGINNIIKTTKKYFCNFPIKTVTGGLHLVKTSVLQFIKSSNTHLYELVDIFCKENIEKLYLGHCTGYAAFKKLKRLMGDRVVRIKSGTKFIV